MRLQHWILILLLTLPAVAVPPLDRDLPEKFETATFGLG